MTTISGSGGAKTITVGAGDKVTVSSFGAFGTGSTPTAPAELDTLQFLGAGMTAGNLLLTQNGSNVIVTFEGVPGTQVTLTNMTVEQLANIDGAGNFRFFVEAAVTDSVDVWNAGQTGSGVDRANTVTFLNDLANTVSGRDGSADVINGQGGNDVLAGLGGNDTLRGGAGNDTLNGGAGADRMVGGNGNDVYVVDNTGDVVVESNGAGGVDTVRSAISYKLGENVENLTLTGHAAIDGTGNGLANVIVGNDAGNALSGGDGDDTLAGNSGDDQLLGGAGHDTLEGGVGNDQLDGGTGGDAMNGGRGDDFYVVDTGADQVIETVKLGSGGGIDTVQASIDYALGTNLDNLTLTGHAVSGIGNEAANAIIGNAVGNVLKGGAGDDRLEGNGGQDKLDGGAGNDRLDGGTDSDTMTGGRGDDTYTIESTGDKVIETDTLAKGGGVDTVQSSISYTLGANLETLILTAFNAQGTGNALDNFLFSNGSGNTLKGGDGNDKVAGGFGDTLLGESGNDTVSLRSGNVKSADGGAGIDTAHLDPLGPTVDLTGALGSVLKGFEVVSLAGNIANALTLNLAAVDALTAANDPSVGPHTLIVSGDTVDKLTLTDTWASAGTVSDPSGIAGTFAKYTNGDATLLVDTDVGVTELGQGTPVDLSKLDGTNGFKIATPSEAAASAGDVNGDGYDDIIIGTTGGGTIAYVVYGHADGFNPTLPLSSAGGAGYSVLKDTSTLGSHFGWSVASAGDVNGDGYADVIVGDFGSNMTKGWASIVFGSAAGLPTTLEVAPLNGSNGFQVGGAALGNQIGWSVASAGDLNGDGYDDIVVGSYDISNAALPGLAYVIFGHAGAFAPDITGANLNGSNGFILTGGSANEFAGHSVASAGDINGDGYDDLIIGGRGGTNVSGESFIVFGHGGGFNASINLDTMTASTGLKINPVSITDGTGMVVPGTTNVSSAGDLNGDGYDDLVIGVYAADPSGKNNAGSTYIVFGHAGFTTAPDLSVVDGTHVVRIDGEKAGDGNGWSVAGAGDVNGDGYSDLIVSSHQVVTASPGNPGVPGEAYVIYGHEDGFAAHIDLSTVKAEDGFKIDGLGSMGFGMTVSSAGDVNGDGYADLAISDYAKSATYIVFGGDFTGSVTHQGGAGDDAILGDANAQNIVAGAGNDVINAGGGKDSIEAGAGDDQIQIADGKFLHIDGGSGFDTLQMNYAGLIDFGDLDGNHATADHGKIESIEAINADNGQANTIIIDLADVLDINPTNHDVGGNASLDNVLKIDGDAGDTLALAKADGWGAADTASLAGYAVYTNQGVHVAVDTAIAVTVN